MIVKKYNLLFLIVGLIFGFILGGGTILLYNHQVNKHTIKLEQSINQTDKNSEELRKSFNQSKKKSQKITNPGTKRMIEPNFIDTIKVDTLNKIDSISGRISRDTMNITHDNDSNGFYFDSLTINSSDLFNNIDEGIVVIKDELLFTKEVWLRGMDSIIRKQKFLDSLLLEDYNATKIPGNLYHLEFWKSPVNYMGYKMSNNRIILFGIFKYELATLEYANTNIYLKLENIYYMLKETDKYRPLIPVKPSKCPEEAH